MGIRRTWEASRGTEVDDDVEAASDAEVAEGRKRDFLGSSKMEEGEHQNPSSRKGYICIIEETRGSRIKYRRTRMDLTIVKTAIDPKHFAVKR